VALREWLECVSVLGAPLPNQPFTMAQKPPVAAVTAVDVVENAWTAAARDAPGMAPAKAASVAAIAARAMRLAMATVRFVMANVRVAMPRDTAIGMQVRDPRVVSRVALRRMPSMQHRELNPLHSR
jgi:hypothetical protein